MKKNNIKLWSYGLRTTLVRLEFLFLIKFTFLSKPTATNLYSFKNLLIQIESYSIKDIQMIRIASIIYVGKSDLTYFKDYKKVE